MSWSYRTMDCHQSTNLPNLQNTLSNLGIIIRNISIEEQPYHLCPDIHIDGYLDNNKAFIGEKIAFTVNKVIFNPPATVILWADETKTVVKCGEQDEFDPEKGLVMAITKKLLGNKGNYYNRIKNILENAVYQYDKDDVYDPNIPRTVVKKLRTIHSPNSTVYNTSYFECPLCGDEILKSGARYCANCGQRLIWEEK